MEEKKKALADKKKPKRNNEAVQDLFEVWIVMIDTLPIGYTEEYQLKVCKQQSETLSKVVLNGLAAPCRGCGEYWDWHLLE
ncbi:UNVERIFIED_CONTAM: hypothetical protein FKN15_019787 [Acipenser sinensis]